MIETAGLRGFAAKARVDLLKEVAARASVVLAENSVARSESASAVRELEQAIARDGRDAVVDRVAYTWFNRLIALRFMDANGYTPSGVVSPAGGGSGQPEVLADAKAGAFDDAVVPAPTQQLVTALLNGTRPSQDGQAEAYGLLLEAYCRHWNRSMPFMFEREGDYTELLIPTALLSPDSVRDRAVKILTTETCRDVEVIGWLYQFYIADRKAEVFDGFGSNRKAGAAEIPAATQLFTPHWIVRYLVENSVGRLWLLNNPTSRLAEQMEYYVAPVDPETDYLKIASPEELTVIDPAVGSGHMLTYAFDLLHAIYTEKGYDPAEIPGLILTHNLHGTEIDPRAGALAAFALTMKAAAKRKLFLKNPVQPNIRVLENIHLDPADLDHLWSHTPNGIDRADADAFWSAFEHADTLGSLIRPLPAPRIDLTADDDLLHAATLQKARAVLTQAEYLAPRYAVSVANPPYMGAKNFGATLGDFAKAHYASSKADLFAMFFVRQASLVRPGGLLANMSPNVWLSLPNYAAIRAELLVPRLRSLVELSRDGFADASVQLCAFVVAMTTPTHHRATFLSFVDAGLKAPELPAAAKAAIADPAAPGRHVVDVMSFVDLPNTLVAYEAPPWLLTLLGSSTPLGTVGDARQGLITGDVRRFVRFWHEVSRSSIGLGFPDREAAWQSGLRWFPLNSGGSVRRWFGNQELVIDWRNDGEDIRTFTGPDGKLRSRPQNLEYLFRPAVGWSSIASEPSFRHYPAGFLFDNAGMSFFTPSASLDLAVLGVLNSVVGRRALEEMSPTINLNAGQVAALPLADLLPAVSTDDVEEAIRLARLDWIEHETAWQFEASPLLALSGSLGDRVARASALATERAAALAAVEASIDDAVSAAAGYEYRADAATPAAFDVRGAVVELVSYAVGCMFGRYSLDAPGLILADEGSTLQQYLERIPSPTFMPDADNVIPIVDGDWFDDDIVARFRRFLRAAFGDQHFEQNVEFVKRALGVDDLRDYFVRSFYDDHVKRYGKRPIYWLFRSPKGSFSALVYLHRYAPTTASTVLTGYLREFIGKLKAELEHQVRVAAGMGGPSARDVARAEKEADRLRKVLVELHAYEDDVLFPLAGRQVALDLDDGVRVNYLKLGPALKDIGLAKGGSE